MRFFIAILSTMGLLLSTKGYSQVSIKTEHIGSSQQMHSPENGYVEKAGDGKGAATIIQGLADIPFSIKKNERDQQTIWGVSLYGARVWLDNQNIQTESLNGISNYDSGCFMFDPWARGGLLWLVSVRASICLWRALRAC